MDFISHILIGRALATPYKKNKKNFYSVIFFSALPDLGAFLQYFYLGYINSRSFFIPLNSDWDGFRQMHPLFSSLWDIPHSIFFAFLIILPLVLFFKLSKMAFIAYMFHIFIDLFTHLGEWAVKPFYPIQYAFQGFTNAWAWPFLYMALLWVVIIVAIIFAQILIQKYNKRTIN